MSESQEVSRFTGITFDGSLHRHFMVPIIAALAALASACFTAPQARPHARSTMPEAGVDDAMLDPSAGVTDTSSGESVRIDLKRLLRSITRLWIGKGSRCSGVIVRDSIVATSYHCVDKIIDGESDILRVLCHGRVVSGEVLRHEKDYDLALVRARGCVGTDMHIGDPPDLTRDPHARLYILTFDFTGNKPHKIALATNSLNAEEAYTQERTRPLLKEEKVGGEPSPLLDENREYLGRALVPGNSGGGIFDSAGQLVGIGSCRYAEHDSSCYSRANALLPMLEGLE